MKMVLETNQLDQQLHLIKISEHATGMHLLCSLHGHGT